MESKLFLEKLRRYGEISKLSHFGLTWNQWAKFAKMTRGLNYGCNFNTKGAACSGRSSMNYGTSRETCCCGGCRSNVGYLNLIPNDEESIKAIAPLFDEKEYGFWRKKKGCILPIEYRSSTCIAYRCAEARRYRDNMHAYSYGPELLEQMILYFLETFRASKLSDTQIRVIIKELIKGTRR